MKNSNQTGIIFSTLDVNAVDMCGNTYVPLRVYLRIPMTEYFLAKDVSIFKDKKIFCLARKVFAQGKYKWVKI